MTTLQELVGRLSRFEADEAAELFAETVDWDVPGARIVPWTGPRHTRAEVADYFKTLWSLCDTAQTENNVHKVVVDGTDAVALWCLRADRARHGSATHHACRTAHHRR